MTLGSSAPAWLEGRFAFEYLRLHRDPLFAGRGVPRGDGRQVLVVPGFMSGDGALKTMRDWLHRIGYASEPAGFKFNIRHSEHMVDRLVRRIDQLHLQSGSRISLVGHSRGGLLAKVAADRRPAGVDRVIALGSPLADPGDLHSHTQLAVHAARLWNRFRHGLDWTVEEAFLEQLAAPARVPLTSIYTRSDAVVQPRACIRPDAVSIRVAATHNGLQFNVAAYRAVAEALAA